MIVKSEHSVEEVLKAMDEAQQPAFKGHPYFFHGDKSLGLLSIRMLSFKINGTICRHCGLVGTVFRKEKHKKDIQTWHLNLYAKRRRQYILMTRDHIIPVSKGGPNTLENSQTLCRHCNGAKADRLPGEIAPPKKPKSKVVSWYILKRRIKFFMFNLFKYQRIIFPSRSGSDVPTVKSFWKM
jgi:hypothetical protein